MSIDYGRRYFHLVRQYMRKIVVTLARNLGDTAIDSTDVRP